MAVARRGRVLVSRLLAVVTVAAWGAAAADAFADCLPGGDMLIPGLAFLGFVLLVVAYAVRVHGACLIPRAVDRFIRFVFLSAVICLAVIPVLAAVVAVSEFAVFPLGILAAIAIAFTVSFPVIAIAILIRLFMRDICVDDDFDTGPCQASIPNINADVSTNSGINPNADDTPVFSCRPATGGLTPANARPAEEPLPENAGFIEWLAAFHLRSLLRFPARFAARLRFGGSVSPSAWPAALMWCAALWSMALTVIFLRVNIGANTAPAAPPPTFTDSRDEHGSRVIQIRRVRDE